MATKKPAWEQVDVDLSTPETELHPETAMVKTEPVEEIPILAPAELDQAPSRQTNPPRSARATKRRHSYAEDEDDDTGDEYTGHSKNRKRSIPRHREHHVPVNDTHPSVCRTSTGVLVEYRCMQTGCLANGTWRSGEFYFYSGLVGLCRHYGKMSDHPKYSTEELATRCVYHQLNEQETAAVLGQSDEGYVIERVWATTKSNEQQARAARRAGLLEDVATNGERLPGAGSRAGLLVTDEDRLMEHQADRTPRVAGSEMDDEDSVMKYETQN